jgi:phosphoserine phosphatase RsbU/P
MATDRLHRMSERLQLNKFKLQTLLEITKGINDNLPISQLVAIYRGIVEGELELSKLVLFTRLEPGWEVLLQFGDQDVDLSSWNPEDMDAFQGITVLSQAKEQIIPGYDIIIPVHHQSRALAYLFIGDMEDEVAISPIIKHMNFIQTITNILVVAVENKRLMRESLRQERMRRELELAAEMQALLVPSEFPVMGEVEVSALYYPHQEVGGDYYDSFQLQDGRHFICIADVSGKGISAAFIMANFQARLRVMAEVEPDISKLVRHLNKSVDDSTKGERFVTFFVAVFDPETRVLTSINAGHNPPLLKNGFTSSFLKKGCMGLGMVQEIPQISVEETTLQKGAVLLCFTDGLVEVENEQGQEYGEKGLEKLMSALNQESMADLNLKVKADFDRFRGGNAAHDDFAVLSARFR